VALFPQPIRINLNKFIHVIIFRGSIRSTDKIAVESFHGQKFKLLSSNCCQIMYYISLDRNFPLPRIEVGDRSHYALSFCQGIVTVDFWATSPGNIDVGYDGMDCAEGCSIPGRSDFRSK